MSINEASVTTVTQAVADHIHDAATVNLAPEIAERVRLHLLDSFIAIISGSSLEPARVAGAYVASRRAAGESTVVATGQRTAPELAALANGMAAHADESDDASDHSCMHPGASIVPAALAVAEDRRASGRDLLRAVAVGYDVGASVNQAAWSEQEIRSSVQSTHGLGQLFGAAAAAASIACLDRTQIRHVLSYCGQRAAGCRTFTRDRGHVEKAYAMGGRAAHDAVSSVAMVSFGFTGVDDIFDGSPNLFDAWGAGGAVSRLPDELGRRDHILRCDIKRHPVGMPMQAPLDAADQLIRAHGLRAADVASVVCHLPAEKLRIADATSMPDVNGRYVLAIMLLDGCVTFGAAHDHDRFHRDPVVADLMRRIDLVADDDAASSGPISVAAIRRGTVDVTTVDGQTFSASVDAPRGNHQDPASWDDVEAKAHLLLDHVRPRSHVEDLIAVARSLATLDDVRDLRRLLDPPT